MDYFVVLLITVKRLRLAILYRSKNVALYVANKINTSHRQSTKNIFININIKVSINIIPNLLCFQVCFNKLHA